MSFLASTQDPSPFRQIKIIDISPYRASIRSRPTTSTTRRRRGERRVAAALVAALFAVALIVATAGATTPARVQPFQLAPGHAVPAALAD